MHLYFCLVIFCPYQLNCSYDQSLDITCSHIGFYKSGKSSYWITGRISVATIHMSIIRCFITWKKWYWKQTVAEQQQKLSCIHTHFSQNFSIEHFYHHHHHLQSVIHTRNMFWTSAPSPLPFFNMSLSSQYIRISLSVDGHSLFCTLSWKNHIKLRIVWEVVFWHTWSFFVYM
jgi:hypothetical protein